ncbi:carboxymuconolactone decarboxylase family protein [Neolewinella litorea]|uniref:Carboxymuconolactone decarboxylase family protein n=1 Tax=Neolewinella litorea TaxID=2562452 RepID=A0A4S4NEK9_9BACT|nr:hypothetical protein [Neolewinella litorea]THH37974.1 hypothetical protein E4021_13155 [Neolewinella litorea]
MASLAEIDWCDTPLVAPTRNTEVEREIRKHLGVSQNSTAYLAPVPWVAWTLTTNMPPVAHISNRLTDLIGLIVSMENSCRHCYGATRSILRLTGYSEKRISQLEEDLYQSDLDERTLTALAFARKCARSDPRPDARDLAELAEVGYSRMAIAEVAYVATSACYSNRLATILAIPPDDIEDLEKNPLARLFRPVIRVVFNALDARAKQRNRKRFPPGAIQACAPKLGGKLIEALRESPTAPMLARILEDCWQSPHLSRRTKALTFVVVAQALNCPLCTLEGRQLMELEGWRQEDIDHLLTYLSSDQLTPFESRFIHFARDTVNYKVPDIQYTARRFLADLKKEEIIEACGLVSLANWVARLSIILEQDR